MFADKTLLLKGVAGVAALGGVGGGAFIFRKELGLAGSSNNDAAKPEAEAQVGSQSGGVSNSLTSESTEDDYGIPKRCNDSPATPCELNEEELKKIKFEALGEGETPAVTVEHFPTTDSGHKISLTIDSSDSTKKKYIFSNGSSGDVIIKRDESKKVTLKAGKTKFTLGGNKLKEKELGEYGEPKDCTSTCTLYADDLEDINFKDLDGGTDPITVSSISGTVSLEIKTVGDTNRYIFTNSGQEVNISKGNDKTVTLTSAKKTKFTGSDNKLNKFTYGSNGIPTSCSNSCTLTADDLGEIKFDALDGGTGTVSPTTQTITLTIESAPKKYKFTNSSGSAITIKKGGDDSKVVTLAANGDTEFTENSAANALKLVEPPGANGVPAKCKATTATNPCSLTADDLKNIKFKNLDGGDVTFDPSTPDPQISLYITTLSNSNPSKIYTFKNSGSKVTLKKGSGGENNSVVLEKGETEFKEESEKLVIYEENSLTALNTKIGNLKLPYSCKFKGSEKDKLTKECNVTVDELKKVEFENKENNDLTVTGPEGNIKLEIKRLKSSDDAEQYGSNIKDNDLRFTFKDTTSKITITGSGSNNIIIPKNSNTEFLINESNSNKLNKSYKNLSGGLPNSWAISCKKDNGSQGNKFNCTPASSDSKIRFFTDFSSGAFQELQINDGNKDKTIFTAEEDVDDYNLGFKFTVKEAISGTGGSPTLNTGDTYEIKWSTAKKKWGYVKKSPS